MKSAGRILDLLELIAVHETPLSLHELTRALEAPKSSTLMLLRTLIAKGYIQRGPDQRYQLDPLYQASEQHWIGGMAGVVRRMARPEMRELVIRVQETVLLGVLRSDMQVQLIEKTVSPRPVRYDTDVHAVVPAYCTALGRAMLAFSEPDLVENYLRTAAMPKVTRNTIVDPVELRDNLLEVRRVGFAVNHEGHLEGACSVAAPLLSGDGKVLGALNVGCVTANFDQNEEAITRNLLESVATLNQRFAASLAFERRPKG